MDVRTSTRLRRQAAAVPAARAFVGHALRSAGVSRDVADNLVQAAAEACNNAILHAAGDTFTVTVTVQGTACTLIVSDIDSTAQQLRESGLVAEPQVARDDRVDTIMIRDPDGNSIAFAAPKDPTLAH